MTDSEFDSEYFKAPGIFIFIILFDYCIGFQVTM